MAKSDEQDYDWLIPLTTRHSGTLTHPHFWGSIAAVRRLNGFLGSGVIQHPATPHREGITVRGRGFTWCRWEGWDIQRLHQGAAKYAEFLLVVEKGVHQDGVSNVPLSPNE